VSTSYHPLLMSQGIFTDTKSGLHYSLYLSLGVLSLFLLANTIYTLILGIVWQYTTDYLVHLALISLSAFVAGILSLLTCYWMVKGKNYSHYTAIASAVLLLFAPILSMLTNTIIAGIYDMMIMMVIPSIAILLLTILFWWKSRQ